MLGLFFHFSLLELWGRGVLLDWWPASCGSAGLHGSDEISEDKLNECAKENSVVIKRSWIGIDRKAIILII